MEVKNEIINAVKGGIQNTTSMPAVEKNIITVSGTWFDLTGSIIIFMVHK
jgi:hypothetical protein